MRFDETDSLIREAGAWPGNSGDSCAETCRALILGDGRADWLQFVYRYGMLRHPSLSETWGGFKDFSGDQFVPLVMASKHHPSVLDQSMWKIRGTKTWLAPAAWFLVRKMYRSLNACNVAQGKIMGLPFRWSDSKARFEKSQGSSADYLNMICIYVFLKSQGFNATLPRPKDECIQAVYNYYLMGSDPEPNSTWIVDMYTKALA